ncbi:MAG: hypothetical protein ACJ8FY_18980 [Gemmataceae bacterium]
MSRCLKRVRVRLIYLLPLLCISIFQNCVLADGVPDPPIQGRPTFAPFSNASGSFQVATLAAPTTLRVEDSLIFTVRITANGPVFQPPERLDLRELPDFAESFYIGDRADRDTADDSSWQFVYQLKPRRLSVRAIPSFPLIYYQPGVAPASRGYMTRWAPSIPLTVQSGEEVSGGKGTDSLAPIDAPSTVYQFIEDRSALRRQQDVGLSPILIGTLFVLPPTFCAAWYLSWRRLYPDAARMARRRRSRAAQRALKLLGRTDKRPAGNQAEFVTEVITNYLRERLDLPSTEPTPAEVADHLQSLGLAPVFIERTVQFFKEADAARFLPSPPSNLPLKESAIALVLSLEAEPCSPSAS